MESLGRFLFLIGLVLVLISGLIYLAARVGLPFGRLQRVKDSPAI